MKKILLILTIVITVSLISVYVLFKIPLSKNEYNYSKLYNNTQLIEKFENSNILVEKNFANCLATIAQYVLRNKASLDGELAFPYFEYQIVKLKNRNINDIAQIFVGYKIANNFNKKEIYSLFLDSLNIQKYSNRYFGRNPYDIDEWMMLYCYYKAISNDASVKSIEKFIIKKVGKEVYIKMENYEKLLPENDFKKKQLLANLIIQEGK